MRSSLDFDRNGKQIGALLLPLSTHADAWGAIQIPAAVLRNGDGPTALLVGGVHGDEYEGPIVLGECIRSLDPELLCGTLIILPALNPPAIRRGVRCSPIDGLDLARVFPGDPGGTSTRQVAHYIARELIPRADFVLDLHAGGTSLEIMTTTMMLAQEDQALQGRTEAAMRSFGAPLALVSRHDAGVSLVSAASAQARVSFAVELGSGGRVSTEALAVARAGIANFLSHVGILPGNSAPYTGPLLQTANPEDLVLAPVEGVFEPHRDLGAQVEAGETAGQVHDLGDPSRDPRVVRFDRAGMLFARRSPGAVVCGSCLAAVATPYRS